MGSGGKINCIIGKNGSGNQKNKSCVLSYFVFSLVVLGSIGEFFARYMFIRRDDNEGSWAVGVYNGDSPFSLKPIENKNAWKNKIADPFHYVQTNGTHHSGQFTLLTMTYDARLRNLKMYVKHYSRCSSVREIIVVWNRGVPAPSPSDFDSAVPLRIRVEQRNSLNNRFRVDPSIETRAVLELDDDIMMPCDDVERGFKVWMKHPGRIVGFYPRLVDGEYKDEEHARKQNGYNMILTGAAFMDHQVAFGRYWSDEAAAGRALVDAFFNCEDVLMNYLYANRSSESNVVEYVTPKGLIDMSRFSGVAISRNMQAHFRVRSKCVREFSDMYGSLSHRKVEFSRREDGWDV